MVTPENVKPHKPHLIKPRSRYTLRLLHMSRFDRSTSWAAFQIGSVTMAGTSRTISFRLGLLVRFPNTCRPM